MLQARSWRRWLAVPALTLAAVLAAATSASAARPVQFFDENAQAFWGPPHTCADGAVVGATLLVSSTRDYSAPQTEDPEPTVRVQFLAVCPDGISFSWGAPTVPASITSRKNLKRVTAAGSGVARDNLGGTHQVSFSVTYRGTGPLERTVNGPGSVRKERVGTATGQVTFDGVVLVAGPADHPTRPAPFIRVDIER